ncbi:ABC transporter ATP-binding protein [Pseudonocardia kunmingensis]|uniref:Peptide/nickel transport system ATP-binding protein/oligopeptide transport system ATP-binding protein n=1 Tax=Pseudonocardia kunmingensis TaxID=630975 RepID=A0A543DI41_9PSEU|nr:oligopeptide/dipeptide ABC transporter ATP-binding protein [Pseudonocardia kunmingensis]TQM09014.1 peptide/nickel transport system ATP-binding protein/oligopeptide transport system ATP-binding protein [Pseudonocardia kunmingensis]
MTPLLDVEDLYVSYATRRRDERVKAVDGVSFAVHEGETLGLIGESGSGKSTLGRALMRLVRPTAGTARLRGTDLVTLRGRAGREMSAHLQMVFQDPHAALDPRMRVLASIEEPLAIRRTGDRERRRARALELLDLVGLSRELGARYPHELSGGQKQRVNIARALVLDPALVVCDEAVSALDVALQAEILELLATLQSELGLAYLFITHDLSVVANIADRVAVMYLGRLMELGPVEQLVTRPRHPYTEALVSAQPRVGGDDGRERIVLQGDIPSPVHPPSGCRFRTRCRYATQRCAEEVPAWRELGPGHRVACHHADVLALTGVGS